ncbi:hypothetical protein AB0C27_52075 [Nonomuraea sp. NPDC048882]|uniref:SbtR family transcriptional regulator n=1 Tax=Nonomuraea sp. NPDC048882 TaxID=3154347 RepID=UPI0033E30FC4
MANDPPSADSPRRARAIFACDYLSRASGLLSDLHASCHVMRQTVSRLLIRAQESGQVRPEVDSLDLAALVNAVGWFLAQAPALAARQERLLGFVPDRIGPEAGAVAPVVCSCDSPCLGRSVHALGKEGRGSEVRSAARKARSSGANLTLVSAPSWRSRTAIWWRRARISTSLSRSPMGSNRNAAKAFVTAR